MNIKKKIEREVAVIFKQIRDDKGKCTYYPATLKIGYLDKETNLFVTKSEGAFHYILDTEYVYGFALRLSLKEFKNTFLINNITLKEAAFNYFKDLLNYSYYFYAEDRENFQDLSFYACDKKTNNSYLLKEKDLNIGKMILNNIPLTNKKTKKNQNQNSKTINFDAKTLRSEIKKTVIGQDNAIDDIVTIIWQNLRSENKSNILLIGPTGVGKTEIIRNITKNLDIPMASINVTDTSQSAYQGTNISDSIVRLVQNANNDVEKASRGIIFIDEIDKKAGSGEYNTGVITTGVQDELLKLLEDNDYEVNISDNPAHPQIVTINTKNITFVCAGAFSNLAKVRKESIPKTIGFTPEKSFPKEESTTSTNTKITKDDLRKYGLKDELIGRLHNIIELSPLTKENLIEIMKNPNNKTIKQKQEILNSLGIKLDLEEEVYEILADKAIKNKTGARGLVGAVDNLFLKAMNEISDDPNNYEELIINKDTVADHHAYKLVKRKK